MLAAKVRATHAVCPSLSSRIFFPGSHPVRGVQVMKVGKLQLHQGMFPQAMKNLRLVSVHAEREAWWRDALGRLPSAHRHVPVRVSQLAPKTRDLCCSPLSMVEMCPPWLIQTPHGKSAPRNQDGLTVSFCQLVQTGLQRTPALGPHPSPRLPTQSPQDTVRKPLSGWPLDHLSAVHLCSLHPLQLPLPLHKASVHWATRGCPGHLEPVTLRSLP